MARLIDMPLNRSELTALLLESLLYGGYFVASLFRSIELNVFYFV
jgi:hypothetical protein